MPLEAPWTSELLIGHGGAWTYLNNDFNGGDPFPAVGYPAQLLSAQAVIAVHRPVTAAGHASTQFQLLGPDGDPQLMYRRTIAAQPMTGTGPASLVRQRVSWQTRKQTLAEARTSWMLDR